MSGWLKAGVGLLILLGQTLAAQAGNLALGGSARWVVIASRPDIDEAIGVARHHRWRRPNVRVVRAANGWFAVVFGPEQVPDPRAFRQKLVREGSLPGDFIFSRGDSYVEQVWAPPAASPTPIASVKYDGRRDALLRLGDTTVTISNAAEKGSSDRHPIAVGRQGGRQVFRMALTQSTRDLTENNGSDFAQIEALRLDPASPRPSLVFTSFWGGAHCCTVTQIATEQPHTGLWSVAEGEALDGDGGYAFEDLDGDGAPELLSGDQSFLYAFAPYTSSNMPTRIARVREGRIENVTRYPEYAPYLRQQLAGMEHSAGLNPEVWRDNGFLGGWIAQSILVGRGEQAWARMLQSYDRASEWTYEVCSVDLPFAKCPEDRRRKVDFPTALRRHLNETGYTTPWLGQSAAPPAAAGPPQYEAAAALFESLPVEQRIRLQVLLTAAGYQVAVPNPSFSKRLYETLLRYQAQSGQTATGMLDEAQTGALMREASPLLRTWGLRTAPHPQRGRPIWVPAGLGLREERTASGVSWSDPAKRVVLSYVGLPDGLEESYRSTLTRFAAEGGRMNYKVIRPDFFAISASGADGLDWYIRFHRDGPGTLGFFLAWKTVETDLHMERVAVLVSGALAAAMNGTPFTDPPRLDAPPAAVAVARPESPSVPTPSAVAPKPPEEKPREASSGTGFYVSRDGHILTNAHVVRDCTRVEVNGPNGLGPVRLVAQDRTNDLALLKSESTPLKIAAVRMGVRLGEGVAVFGYPLSGMLSTSGNFTLGNVTALSGLGDDSRYFQISAPVQPGNSGGPLVDANGNLIGVVTSKLNALKVMVATNGDIPQNVNFAIKGSVASAFLESNGVAFTQGSDTAALQPADLADHAKALSVYVSCR